MMGKWMEKVQDQAGLSKYLERDGKDFYMNNWLKPRVPQRVRNPQRLGTCGIG
jgi:hypothetical protein